MTTPAPAPTPPPTLPVQPKPGWKSTELWATIAFNLAVLISALADALSPHWAAIAGSVVTGLYAISRGLSKLNPPKPTE